MLQLLAVWSTRQEQKPDILFKSRTHRNLLSPGTRRDRQVNQQTSPKVGRSGLEKEIYLSLSSVILSLHPVVVVFLCPDIFKPAQAPAPTLRKHDSAGDDQGPVLPCWLRQPRGPETGRVRRRRLLALRSRGVPHREAGSLDLYFALVTCHLTIMMRPKG